MAAPKHCAALHLVQLFDILPAPHPLNRPDSCPYAYHMPVPIPLPTHGFQALYIDVLPHRGFVYSCSWYRIRKF